MWLKRLHEHFVPSEQNGFRPHFLRARIAAGLLGLMLVIEALYMVQTLVVLPSSDYLAAIFASVLVEQTNQERVTAQLPNLKENPKLALAAQMKANDMAQKGYFSHNSPDGTTPWFWFKQAGYTYAAAGENLAVNFSDSKDVTIAWMNSPAHRANIMNGNYTEIGIATARGTYKGKEAIFVVQEFGRPSVIARDLSPGTTTPNAGVFASGTSAVSNTAPNLASRPRGETSFVATVNTTTSPANGEPTVVAGAETTKLGGSIIDPIVPVFERATPSFFASVLTTPRQTTTLLYLLLATIIAIALVLAVFVEFRIQHPHLIMNGLLLIAISLSLVLLNAALGFTQGVI